MQNKNNDPVKSIPEIVSDMTAQQTSYFKQKSTALQSAAPTHRQHNQTLL